MKEYLAYMAVTAKRTVANHPTFCVATGSRYFMQHGVDRVPPEMRPLLNPIVLFPGL